MRQVPNSARKLLKIFSISFYIATLRMIFRKDPCGIICITITYLAMIYADYVVLVHLILPSLSDSAFGALNAVLFNTCIFFMISAHLRAVLSDPGIVPFPQTSMDFSDMHSGQRRPEKADGWTVCTKCDMYRPPRAHHCRICNRCIRRMDHHCPWVNNCVGEFNQKYFIQFLFYVGISSVYAISLVIAVWVMDTRSGKKQEWQHDKVMHTVGLVVESCLFGLFVIAIGCDQMNAILHDETAVEQIKKQGPYENQRTTRELLADVFGKGPAYLWLLPCHSRHVLTELPSDHVV